MKSRAERIREKLTQNPGANAVALAKKLGVTSQHVYQVRYDMKKQQERLRAEVAERTEVAERLNRAALTRQENSKPLSQYILTVLESTPQGLTCRAIVDAVQKAGYKTRSATFVQVVRQKLYDMVEIGHIVKNGTNNYIHANPPKAGVAVPAVQNVLEVLQELSHLCKRVGGIEALRAKLDLLQELQSQ